MNFALNLKRVREEKKLTQLELANKANIKQPTLAQIERGTKIPTVNLALELAKALEVKLEDLLK